MRETFRAEFGVSEFLSFLSFDESVQRNWLTKIVMENVFIGSSHYLYAIYDWDCYDMLKTTQINSLNKGWFDLQTAAQRRVGKFRSEYMSASFLTRALILLLLYTRLLTV